MPIYMDRHDVSDAVTAEIVAQLHQEDLKIQHLYGCKGLTYWFDDGRKTAFCLVEAPNKEALINMHNNAHGEVPHSIIEVEGQIVESFLGRIEDPGKARNTSLNIINDPAFRIIVVWMLKSTSYVPKASKAINNAISFRNSLVDILGENDGRLVKNEIGYFLASFTSVTASIRAALEINKRFEQIGSTDLILDVGLSAGVPVTEKEGIFEDTIKMSEALCHVAQKHVVITQEVRDLYESENLNTPVSQEFIYTISHADGRFMNSLMELLEKVWANPDIKVDQLCKELGYSKSQLNRKLVNLTGQSPKLFLRKFKLQKALILLQKNQDTISEIAFNTGFNSAAYFSKSFLDAYGVLPSKYGQ